uniref:MAM domain-containing protein n=1 Tax=Setaria digitata TaxID=48799 RepID=A0A915PIX5_9BILA
MKMRFVDVFTRHTSISGEGCISTSPRAFSPGASVQQFSAIPPPATSAMVGQTQGTALVAAPQQVPSNVLGAGSVIRPAISAAGPGPIEPIPQQHLLNNLLGSKITLHEFDSNGYNAEGGGPVAAGEALSCDFDSRACCWANVPPPDDQLDWHLANGAPDLPQFQNAPIPSGNYLVTYASSSAPSDEAQFASCAIGCASSPIIVRARHWQSENVLLQICQRESFPNTVNFNPLLNCQEFPLVNGLGATELVLPKASLIDIVFVASNFVSERGDMAILDDIEVVYESDGDDCGTEQEERKASEMNGKAAINMKEHGNDLSHSAANSTTSIKLGDGKSFNEIKTTETASLSAPVAGSLFSAALSSSPESGSSGSALLTQTKTASVRSPSEGSQALASRITTSSSDICNTVKCSFENRNICNYKEAHQTESIRGVTTSFQVVTGQYMNKVTGVKEGTEGDYYAATFLYPREMAGLAVDIADLKEPIRLRFQYYEGTHGVQLKGCCESLEHCLFASDKFVSVSDRTWKLTAFTCPAGTSKILFVCENTRTNQGACAIDDIQMIENGTTDLRTARTFC